MTENSKYVIPALGYHVSCIKKKMNNVTNKIC